MKALLMEINQNAFNLNKKIYLCFEFKHEY